MARRKRSIAKAITFRVAATIITVILVFFFTDNLNLASTIGFLDLISKLILYYLHERAWNIVSLGKE